MEISNYYNLLSDVDNASSLEELSFLCGDFCRAVTVPYFMLAVIEQVPLYTPEIRVLSNHPGDWPEACFKNRPEKFDSFIQYVLEYQTPIRWSSEDQDIGLNNSFYSELIDLTREQGGLKGFTIPFKSVTGEVVVFSMASPSGDRVQQRLDLALPMAHTFATLLFARYTTLMRYLKMSQKQLTKRELDCLFWACEGKTAWEISQIINVSERTVLFHLNNSTKKLCACNRQHAVALATSKGLVKPDISRVRLAPPLINRGVENRRIENRIAS